MIPSADGRGLRFSIACAGFAIVEVPGGLALRVPGQAASAAPGTPDLPHLSRLLPRPKGTRTILAIQGLDPTNVHDVAVAPAEGYRLEEDENGGRALRPYRQQDPAVFRIDRYWPPELGRLEEAAIGTQTIVRVECCPVQYNPVTRIVRFYRRLEGELRFESR